MKDIVLNFILRSIFGVIGIYVVNTLFSMVPGLNLHIGLNLLNLLTIGNLGISGFGLVLAVSAFSLL